ncbi:MAG: ATP-dependent helicase C-terminal domain-containing protein, partial [Bacteroidales bacterium]
GLNRKIIVSTNVAETSLTIDGITAVIDSGTAIVARFDPTRNVNGLFVEPISRSSADQRAGRAGRTAPGSCYRLWPIQHHESRPLSIEPEIHRIDLSGTLLGILAAGFPSADRFPWLEKPETSRISGAMDLLRLLGAVSDSGILTPIGKEMAELPVHPRWARVLCEARALGVWNEAALVVAVSQGGELFTKTLTPQNNIPDANVDLPPSDLICAGYVLASRLKSGATWHTDFEPGLSQRDLQEAGQTFGQLAKTAPKTPFSKQTINNLLKCLLSGFPDHIARHVASGSPHYKTTSGVSGQLTSFRVSAEAPYILYSRIAATSVGSKNRVALQGISVVDPQWIESQCRAYFTVTERVEWIPSMQRVMQKRETWLGALSWKQELNETPDDDTAAELLSQLIIGREIAFPAWDEAVENFLRRVRFTARHNQSPGIEDIDNEAFRWILQQAIYKARSAKEVAKRALWPSLHAWLRPGDKEILNWFAPESIQLPGRRRPTPIRYCENGEVILSDTIQNLYNCPTPVTVAGGHTEVLYELLAPSRRPVQLTANLDAFWHGSYKEIRKELKGRYPKHEWREF